MSRTGSNHESNRVKQSRTMSQTGPNYGSKGVGSLMGTGRIMGRTGWNHVRVEVFGLCFDRTRSNTWMLLDPNSIVENTLSFEPYFLTWSKSWSKHSRTLIRNVIEHKVKT